MTNKIIALVDGSIYASSVCEHAGWIASQDPAPVELLHVMGRREPAPQTDLSGTIRLGARSALLEQLASLDEQRARLAMAQSRALLEDARTLTLNAGATEVTTRLEQGDLIDHVTSRSAAPSMIVLGKRGAAADFAKGHLGSNLERVVRAARVPVLVAARAFRPVRSVLLAFDGGGSAMKAVDFMAASPVFADLRIEVATVAPAMRDAQTQLEEATLRLRAAGRSVQAQLLDGSPDTALIERIERQDHDLLVMGAYGHSRIRRLIIGSVTTQMLTDARRSVLLFR